MKAVFFKKHGESEVLEYGDFADPAPKADEVLVELKAAALNHLDIWVRKGLPNVTLPLPHIGGSDGAGVVLKTGKSVKGFKAGDRVLLSPGMGCGQCAHCENDWDSLCDAYHLLGLQVNGTYAQKIAVNERRLIKVSDKLSFEEWASVPLVFVTAWHMLHTHAGIKSSDTVLVHAAGSGIGSAAIQIARLAGARVITTVGSESKIPKAKKLGAQDVINYKQKDFSDAVKDLTGGKGATLVFEHIGPETWEKNLKCLAKGGRLVTCGATSGPKIEMDLRFLYMRQFTIKGSYMGSLSELKKVIKFIDHGKLKPVMDKVFPLKDARLAQEHMESRSLFGKIILKP